MSEKNCCVNVWAPLMGSIQGGTFPELHKDPQTVMDIINDEEAQFLKTLSRGRNLFEKSVKQLPEVKGGEQKFPGKSLLASLSLRLSRNHNLLRRRCLPPLRHLRFPHRPDPTDG